MDDVSQTAIGDAFGSQNTDSGIAVRLRLLEERLSELRKRLQLLEHNSIEQHRKSLNDLKGVNADSYQLRRELRSLSEKFSIMVQELQFFAKREDVMVLQKYADLLNPIQLVTRDQVERIVNKIVDERLNVENAVKRQTASLERKPEMFSGKQSIVKKNLQESIENEIKEKTGNIKNSS